MALEYMLGADSAIVLDYKGSDQAVVKGLGRMSMPGMTRTIVTIDEMRNEFARKFTGGGSYGDITAGGNFVIGDTDGQDKLKQHWLSRTKLKGADILFFLDYNHFFTTDLANDPDSCIQVADVLGGEADKNGVYPFNVKFVPGGRLAIYSAHLVEGATPTLAFVQGSGSADTITDSASGFVTAGFKVGQTLLIIGSTSNDAIAATITAVAAGTLTLSTSGEVTAEAGVEGMELHGGAL